MDGVLEEAASLCACKLLCTLLLLPSLASSCSPVCFCCCCLLVFTDVLVTVVLSVLCVLPSWLTPLTPSGDLIALRFLLFLAHTYGGVLLLTTPLIAVETLTRILRLHTVTVASEETEAKADVDETDEDGQLSHAVGYLCCLSAWAAVALDVGWQVGEASGAACLDATHSLLRCLPGLLSPAPRAASPCWGLALLAVLLLLLTSAAVLHGGRRRPAAGNSGTSEAARCVDPEKTQSSCGAPTALSTALPSHGALMTERRHGDAVLLSLRCLSADAAGQRTEGAAPLILIMEDASVCVWRRGLPGPGAASVLAALAAALSVCVLPLNLGVNILLVRSVETLLEGAIAALLSSTATHALVARGAAAL